MLEVQKYIYENGLLSLEKDFAITLNFHEKDERVILNYNQLESPKLNEKVRDCRALTLNSWTGEIIARSFRRFLNWSEGTRDEMNRFNWDKCWTTEKCDGSLLLVYYWHGQWNVQTRNSYADGLVNGCGYTWRQIAEMAIDLSKLEPVSGRTYNFELCTPYNQVVKIYKQPTAYLLTIFDGEVEWTHDAVENFAQDFGLTRPFSVFCRDPFEVSYAVAREAERDKRSEGFVVRDCFNARYKFKSEEYLRLSHLSNNGNICNVKHIVPIVLKGEQDEMIAYFPYIEEVVYKVDIIISDLLETLDNFWFVNSVEKSKKSFALGIEKCPLKGILFGVYGKTYEEVDLRKELSKNLDNVIEYVKGTL